jgi:hypothetical protein
MDDAWEGSSRAVRASSFCLALVLSPGGTNPVSRRPAVGTERIGQNSAILQAASLLFASSSTEGGLEMQIRRRRMSPSPSRVRPPPRRMAKTDSREQRWTGWIAICATVAGIPVAIMASRPFSSLVIGAMALIGTPIFLYLWARRSTSSGVAKRRFGISSAAVVVLLLCIVTALAIPSTRHFLLYRAIGFKNPPDALKVEPAQVAVLANANYYRFRFAIRNGTSREQLVTHLRLAIRILRFECAPPGYAFYYRVDDLFDSNARDGVVTEHTSDPAETSISKDTFKLAGSGEVLIQCGAELLLVNFTPSMTLSPNNFTIFVIDVPRSIKVGSGNEAAGASKSPASPSPAFTLDLPIKDGSAGVGKIVLEVSVSGTTQPILLCKLVGSDDRKFRSRNSCRSPFPSIIGPALSASPSK